MRKFYEEAVLLEQAFVIDGDKRVKAAIEAAGQGVGAPGQVAGFVRFALGEGIEKGAGRLRGRGGASSPGRDARPACCLRACSALGAEPMIARAS